MSRDAQKMLRVRQRTPDAREMMKLVMSSIVTKSVGVYRYPDIAAEERERPVSAVATVARTLRIANAFLVILQWNSRVLNDQVMMQRASDN